MGKQQQDQNNDVTTKSHSTRRVQSAIRFETSTAIPTPRHAARVRRNACCEWKTSLRILQRTSEPVGWQHEHGCGAGGAGEVVREARGAGAGENNGGI